MNTTMKHKIIKYLLVLLIVFLTSKLQAQQDPQFTHYMYNMSVMNPAYATDNADVINFGGLYRKVWNFKSIIDSVVVWRESIRDYDITYRQINCNLNTCTFTTTYRNYSSIISCSIYQ